MASANYGRDLVSPGVGVLVGVVLERLDLLLGCFNVIRDRILGVPYHSCHMLIPRDRANEVILLLAEFAGAAACLAVGGSGRTT
jgi:hypothetical protein